jgi:hypothetical protein
MIYIFNSGSRPIYQENILSTLFLPYGWTNEYRYSSRNIQKNLLAKAKKLEGIEEAIWGKMEKTDTKVSVRIEKRRCRNAESTQRQVHQGIP